MIPRINFAKIAFWVGLTMIGYIFILLVGEGSKSYRLHNQADQLQGEISQLQSDTEELSYKIAYYATDMYKERLARQELNLQAPGESVVIVRRPVVVAQPKIQMNQPVTREPKSNFQAWTDFLLGF